MSVAGHGSGWFELPSCLGLGYSTIEGFKQLNKSGSLVGVVEWESHAELTQGVVLFP